MTYEQARPTSNMSEPAPRQTLYPPIEPFSNSKLQVSDTHSVYYEVSGKPDGLPICFVHGGPGGGTEPAHRRFFDPDGTTFIALIPYALLEYWL